MKRVIRNIGGIILLVFAWKCLTIGMAYIAIPILPFNYPGSISRDLTYSYDFGLNLPYWVKIWGNFDGYYYLSIAKDGYQSGIVPYFPLYPLFIRAIRTLFEVKRLIIGQGISLVALVGALWGVRQLFSMDVLSKKRNSLALFFLLILAFPTAFYYGATYNDSLFFFFATMTILASRKKMWVTSSITGALAVLTRLNGLALLPYLIIEHAISNHDTAKSWQLLHLSQHIKTIRSDWKRIAPLLMFFLIPLAFIGYLVYIHITFTDWHLLFSAMKPWGQDKLVLPPQVIWRYFKIFFFSFQPSTVVWWVAVVEFSSLCFYLFLLYRSWRILRPSYWVFFALSVLIPWLTGTLQGMPRYGLHVYPMFLALFLWLEPLPRTQKILYFTITFGIFFFGLTLFTRGVFFA